MTATPQEYIVKAESVLDDARRFVAVSTRIAAREAYMAAFHAAEALILARTGRVAKTHKGVNSTFSLLVRDEPALGESWAPLLAGSYEIKQQADYGIGPQEPQYTAEDAERVIGIASRLIDIVKALCVTDRHAPPY